MVAKTKFKELKVGSQFKLHQRSLIVMDGEEHPVGCYGDVTLEKVEISSGVNTAMFNSEGLFLSLVFVRINKNILSWKDPEPGKMFHLYNKPSELAA